MSSRKRPLAEISQPHSTPSRYAPSTPHAIRALQQRSGAKTRSVRTLRRGSADVVRPDSIRGVLRQFAKISAPVTKKRIVTPSSAYADKENQQPTEGDDENDSFMINKPNLTLAIEDSIEEDDSELLAAPTPSILPGDDDEEQPTVTFQNVSRFQLGGQASARPDKRIRRSSNVTSEGAQTGEQEEEDEGDVTIMTERGRRAISEEVTGRFSRYSFGSIRMSDFGSELEVRRESTKFNNMIQVGEEDYVPVIGDDSFRVGETEDLRKYQRPPSVADEDDTVQMSPVGNDTFRLELPPEAEEANAEEVHNDLYVDVVPTDSVLEPDHSDEDGAKDIQEIAESPTTSRRQTLLEVATSQAQKSRRKRLKLTRHGTTVPSLPTNLVKRVVLDSYEQLGKRKPKLGRDHMQALEQATEWFFEQAGEDLAAYSSHGKRRRRVDADDVLLLMRRQKVLSGNGELQQMAKRWLPKEVRDDIELPKE